MNNVQLEHELDPFDQFFGLTTNYVYACDYDDSSSQVFMPLECHSQNVTHSHEAEP